MKIELLPLPFSRDALEPVITARTLDFHYGKHHAGYVDRLIAQLHDTPLMEKSLEEVVRISWKKGNMAVFNNAAQAWNHQFYWESLSPENQQPTSAIAALVERDFGGTRGVLEALNAAATNHFGSGWVWLVLDGDRLQVITTANADTPLINERLFPLLTIDVWEHAYYLDYQNDREGHVAAVAEKLLNWCAVNNRLQLFQADAATVKEETT